jgi:sec-independent protein translocase protein TatA
MVGLDNPIHLLFLLVIVLLIFGAKRLPEMGRSLGAGLRGFKESVSGETPDQSAGELTPMSASRITADPSEPAGDPLAHRADAPSAA